MASTIRVNSISAYTTDDVSLNSGVVAGSITADSISSAAVTIDSGTITATSISLASITGTSMTAGTFSTIGAATLSAAAMFASSEDLADGGACDLTKTVSYFTTGTAETGTLALGADGQIKVLYMVVDAGDMVITVTNPQWGGSGTLTFDTVNQCVILMYFNSKWNIISNTGSVTPA